MTGADSDGLNITRVTHAFGCVVVFHVVTRLRILGRIERIFLPGKRNATDDG